MSEESEINSLDKALDGLREAYKKMEKSYDDIVDSVDDETKIAIVRWAMKHIVEHAREGGSYRYLIYDRMGFDMDAYAPLCSDGLTISNEFDLNIIDRIRDVVRENNYDKLKPLLSLCDEPDCYAYASCGWPSENGYRHTCSTHYKRD